MVDTRPESKVCSKCKNEKPLIEFAYSFKGGKPKHTPLAHYSEICAYCRVEARKLNGDKNRVANAGSKAKRLGVENTLTLAEWLNILDASNGNCHYCQEQVGKENLTIDHIVPLSKGGPNTKANVVAACWPCNNSKSSARETPKRLEPPNDEPEKEHTKRKVVRLPNSPFVSHNEVAAILDISTSRVRQLCRSGELVAERIERTWIITRADLEAYLEKPKSAAGYPKGRPRKPKGE